MKKEFVTYELALRMKALQFDYDCFAFYQIEYHEDTTIMVDDDAQYRVSGLRTCKNSEIPEHYIAAPLYQQVFRWLYQKLDIEKGVMPLDTESQQLLLKELIDKVSSKHSLV